MRNRVTRSIIGGLTVAVISVSLGISAPNPARAQFGIVTDVGHTAATVGGWIKEQTRFIWERADEALKYAREVAMKVVIKGYIRTYLKNYAEYTAKKIATGQPGQEPLFPWKEFSKEIQDAGIAAGMDLVQTAVMEGTTQFGFMEGFDICQPINPQLTLDLYFVPITFTDPNFEDPDPFKTKCNLSVLAENLRKVGQIGEDVSNLSFNDPSSWAKLGASTGFEVRLNTTGDTVKVCKTGPKEDRACNSDMECSIRSASSQTGSGEIFLPKTYTSSEGGSYTFADMLTPLCIGGDYDGYTCLIGDPEYNLESPTGDKIKDSCESGSTVLGGNINADGGVCVKVGDTVCFNDKNPTDSLDPNALKEIQIPVRFSSSDAECAHKCVPVQIDSFDSLQNLKYTNVGIGAGINEMFSTVTPQNETSQLLSTTQKALNKAVEEQQKIRDKQQATKGSNPPSNTTGQYNKTSGAAVDSQIASTQQSLTEEVTNTTWDLAVEVLTVFTKTLASEFMKGSFDDGFNPKDPQSPFAQIPDPNTGTVKDFSATTEFLSVFKDANVALDAGAQDVLSDMMICPSDPDVRTINNCVITPSLRNAISQGLTVREAIDQGFLPSNYVFGYNSDGTDPNYNEGFSYRALLILQKYRIVPRAWTLIAEFMREADHISGVQGSGMTVQDLIDRYDDAPENPEDNPYYRLFDPNWVLTAPAQYCKLSGYGNKIQNRIVGRLPIIQREPDGSIPTNPDGSAKTKYKVINSVVRSEYCADEQSCVVEREDGSCLYYGYCTKEKPIWRFDGTACPIFYDSCRSLSTSAGDTLTVLTDTLHGQNVCNASNVGCAQYAYPDENGILPSASQLRGNSINQQYTGSDVVYLSSKAESCSPAAEGCTELIPTMQPDGSTVSLLSSGTYNVGLEKAHVTDKSLDCRNDNTDFGGPDRYVGCNEYARVDNASVTITAVARSGDACDAACVGYDTFDKQAVDIGGGVSEEAELFIDLIPSTARTCSADAVGCEEFTDITPGSTGESIVSYKIARSCALERDAAVEDVETYFTWQGPETSGFGLKSWKLLKTSASGFEGGPCTHFDADSKTCADTGANIGEFTAGVSGQTGDPSIGSCNEYVQLGWYELDVDGDGTGDEIKLGSPVGMDAVNVVNVREPDPDCREFIDRDGNSFYAFESHVVFVSDECRQYRRTADQKIYNILPDESVQCDNAEAGCRAYKGNTGYGDTVSIPTISFKSDFDITNWTSTDFSSVGFLSMEPVSIEPQSTSDNSLAMIAPGSILPPFIYTGITADAIINPDKNNVFSAMVLPDQPATLELRLYERTAGAGTPSDATDDVYAEVSNGLLASVQTRYDWNVYTVGFRLPNTVNPENLNEYYFGFVSTSGNSTYVDNVRLAHNDDIHLIKNTWRYPVDGSGVPMCGGADLGCATYRNKNGTQINVSRFANLCPVDFVGCLEFIDTKNSERAESEVLANRYGPLDDEGNPSMYESVVPADEIVYRVYNPEISGLLCESKDAGCRKLGKVSYKQEKDESTGVTRAVVSSVSPVYMKDTPELYSSIEPIWCGPAAVDCERFSAGDGNVFYAYNPNDKICEYDSVLDAWYVQGTKDICPLDLYQGDNRADTGTGITYDNIERVELVVNSEMEPSGYVLEGTADDNLRLNGFATNGISNFASVDVAISKPREAYAYMCEKRYDTCTLYADPSISTEQKKSCYAPADDALYQSAFARSMNINSTDYANIYADMCQPYSYLSNSVSSEGCSGEDADKGCLAFGRKDGANTETVGELVDGLSDSPLNDIEMVEQDAGAVLDGVVLNVEKDRICAETIVPANGTYVTTHTGERMYSRGMFRDCKEQTGGDQCDAELGHKRQVVYDAADIHNDDTIYETFRNLSGYSLSGLSIDGVTVGAHMPVSAMTVQGGDKINGDGDFESIVVTVEEDSNADGSVSPNVGKIELGFKATADGGADSIDFGLYPLGATNLSITNGIGEKPFEGIASGSQVLRVSRDGLVYDSAGDNVFPIFKLGSTQNQEREEDLTTFQVGDNDVVVATAKVMSIYDEGVLYFDVDCGTEAQTETVKTGPGDGNTNMRIMRNTIYPARNIWQNMYFYMMAKAPGSCSIVVNAEANKTGGALFFMDNVTVGSAMLAENLPPLSTDIGGYVGRDRQINNDGSVSGGLGNPDVFVPNNPADPSDIQRPLVGPSCRLYPTDNASACNYTDPDSKETYFGYYGYCLIPDPDDQGQCLMWHPTDCAVGEKCLFDISGSSKKYEQKYDKQDGLVYCIHGADIVKAYTVTELLSPHNIDNGASSCENGAQCTASDAVVETHSREIELSGSDRIPIYRIGDSNKLRVNIQSWAYKGKCSKEASIDGDAYVPKTDMKNGQYTGIYAFASNVGSCGGNSSAYFGGSVKLYIDADHVTKIKLYQSFKSGCEDNKNDPYADSLFAPGYCHGGSEPPAKDTIFMFAETNSSNTVVNGGKIRSEPYCRALVQVVDDKREYTAWETRLGRANSEMIMNTGQVLNLYEDVKPIPDPATGTCESVYGYYTNLEENICERKIIHARPENPVDLPEDGYIPYQSRIWGSYSAADSSVYESGTSLIPPFGATTGSWETNTPLTAMGGQDPKTNMFILEGDHLNTGQDRSSYAYSYATTYSPYTPFATVPQCIAKNPLLGSNPPGTAAVLSKENADACVDTFDIDSDNGIIAWHNPTDIAYDAWFFAVMHGSARLASLFPVTTYAWSWDGSQYTQDLNYRYDCRNPGSDACGFASSVGWDTKFDEEKHTVNIENMIINYVTESVDVELIDPTFKTGKVVRLAFDVEANPDQLPIKKIQVNWGDGSKVETLDALRNINNSRVELTHTYNITPEECGVDDGCWIEDGKFKVVVDAIDNWCWTTRGHYTPANKGCVFDNVTQLKETKNGLYGVFKLISIINS